MDAAIFFIHARYNIDLLTVRRANELLGRVDDADKPAVLAYIRQHRPDLDQGDSHARNL